MNDLRLHRDAIGVTLALRLALLHYRLFDLVLSCEFALSTLLLIVFDLLTQNLNLVGLRPKTGLKELYKALVVQLLEANCVYEFRNVIVGFNEVALDVPKLVLVSNVN